MTISIFSRYLVFNFFSKHPKDVVRANIY
ncbi:hypothetical protein DNTS_008195 [Danionella cerebrum]|uniref:Uncharacterized protein n=1 Tax=Danionella cerebrum TaxID=2873325 RepID=A0A553R5I2_9TELE|nr:hypothetical protein DNTS_008195 [Danionella translucida]